nr:hypothetical protein [Limnobaculum zhutongyuii]
MHNQQVIEDSHRFESGWAQLGHSGRKSKGKENFADSIGKRRVLLVI